MTGMHIKRRSGHPSEWTLSAEKLCKPIYVHTGIYKFCLALHYSLVYSLLIAFLSPGSINVSNVSVTSWFALYTLHWRCWIACELVISKLYHYYSGQTKSKVSQITFNMLKYNDKIYPPTASNRQCNITSLTQKKTCAEKEHNWSQLWFIRTQDSNNVQVQLA